MKIIAGHCHESPIQIKTHGQLSTEREVRYQISRWQRELHLNWNKEDADEVLNYLDQRYYHFRERP
jgi:hypothetical protein